MIRCAACQFDNPDGMRFCGGCGQPLEARAAADRRQLTVMFCDLVGSTALADRLDLEELVDLVRAYQDAAGQAIRRFEGHVAQHLGDGLLVYFGYPVAHEDDVGFDSGFVAERFQHRFDELRFARGIDVDLRCRSSKSRCGEDERSEGGKSLNAACGTQSVGHIAAPIIEVQGPGIRMFTRGWRFRPFVPARGLTTRCPCPSQRKNETRKHIRKRLILT